MVYNGAMGLQHYLKRLAEAGEMTPVTVPVNRNFELAALCRREFARPNGGRALFFEQVTDATIPVAANLFGSEKRLCLLLNTPSLTEFKQKLSDFLQLRQGLSRDRLKLPEPADSACLSELRLSTNIDLRSLPAIRSWPQECKPYLTLALAITRHPQTGEMNLGLYRAQIHSARSVAVNFTPGSGAARHLEAATACQKNLPVSLVLGSDPGLIWAAAAPLPPGCNEFSFYRKLVNPSLQLTAGTSQPLAIPAAAEIVIEGEIRPGATIEEGPFGNHTGQYVTRPDCPLMQVSAVLQRDGAIMPMTVVGPPPSENIQLAKANEILIREMLKIDFPQITGLRMPQPTFYHHVAVMTIKSQSAGRTRDLIQALWRDSPVRRSRLLVLLDDDIDINSFSMSWWRSINLLSAERIYQDNGRMAIDATGVDPARLVKEDRQTQQLLNRRRKEYNL